ncbi:globin [Arhodomonas sp. SL1]|uniref:globin n=1 Tax=Arhodomonas sp. SL1 TaxID=3425691 RepID=UPI003F8814B4
MPQDAVRNSYARCLLADGFIDRFYEHFIDSHPSIRPMFRDTDFTIQNNLLRQGLGFAFEYARGSDSAERHLQRIRRTHSREGRNPVPPELYGYWIESMIAAAAECDPQWDEHLEAAWRRMLEPAVEYIRRGY